MNCGQCGNEPPEDSRYCNMCGVALGGEPHVAESPGVVQHRWIYIDLIDLKLPAHMRDDRRSFRVVSYLFDAALPHLPMGWEWVTHPSSYKYDAVGSTRRSTVR